jgi:signal transduction histidine kinase
MAELKWFKTIHVPRIADLPSQPVPKKETWLPPAVKSIVAIPMVYGRALIGFLCFSSEHEEKVWKDEEIGLLKGVAGTFVSALVRKQAEEALREYSEQLEMMVGYRTKELREAQEQLVHQEKLAILGELAGGMAHELRNPLGAIKNAAYLLGITAEESGEKTKETLEILNKEVVASEMILTSLLDFAQARPPTLTDVDLNKLVQRTLSYTTMPNNIEVVTQLDDNLPTIRADRDQLDQVFRNIISNGIQAMPEGGQLTIKTAICQTNPPEPPGLGRTTVSFTDTGMGIPEENLEKVFEPLFSTKVKGIGLGLAIVKALIEGHGGTVEVESSVGQGSTFTLRLPAVGK